ncbi:uncharacterized protein LOC132257428 [Phlebotomus argentipes]|uniref:uncharacterized protein LOC132257428 n=1 Tax=Phlebotomus argentipes TaxID=94469 RepID=UPI0028933511|nr:uncharacterized protein LOC132257428 [Phlebotomus argentipes]XP_059610300.1 uncharacterized protein LOC132257428 [Phlebotomus argentipes]
MNAPEEIAEFCLIKSTLAIPERNFFGKPLLHLQLPKITLHNVLPENAGKFLMHNLKNRFMPTKSFDEMRTEMIDLGNGTFKKILTEGFGEVLEDKKSVTVHYSIFREGDEMLCDSTYFTEDPYKFSLGDEYGILPEFERVVRTMRDQEKAQFIIPNFYSIGNAENTIEEDSKSVFLEIEVLSITKSLTWEENIRLLSNYSETLKLVHNHYKRGHAAFSSGFFRVAASEYTQSVSLLNNVLIVNGTDNDKRMQLLMKMCVNAGMSLAKLDEHENTLMMLNRARKLVETGVSAQNQLKGKIYLNISRSCRALNRITEALENLGEAFKYLGDIQETDDEFQLLSKVYDKHMKERPFQKLINYALDSQNVQMEKSGVCKNQNIFEEVFLMMMKTFMSESSRTIEFFGVESKYCTEWANKVISHHKSYKVRQGHVEVHKYNQGYVRYIIILPDK